LLKEEKVLILQEPPQALQGIREKGQGKQQAVINASMT
jgi:hypothetical protein